MHTKREICEKIECVFPNIGVCGVDLNVDFDKKNKAWSVDLHRDGHHLKTFLEIDEADGCIDKDKCVSLGLQIAQLRDNLKLYPVS